MINAKHYIHKVGSTMRIQHVLAVLHAAVQATRTAVANELTRQRRDKDVFYHHQHHHCGV